MLHWRWSRERSQSAGNPVPSWRAGWVRAVQEGRGHLLKVGTCQNSQNSQNCYFWRQYHYASYLDPKTLELSMRPTFHKISGSVHFYPSFPTNSSLLPSLSHCHSPSQCLYHLISKLLSLIHNEAHWHQIPLFNSSCSLVPNNCKRDFHHDCCVPKFSQVPNA